MTEIDGADVVINLAGRSVDCRYTERNLREMRASRIDSTRIIGVAISQAARPPAVWLQASTATIYAHRFDQPNDEVAGILGGDRGDTTPHHWLASVYLARDWERALNDAATPKTRRIAMRSAITLSSDRGSIFDVLRNLARIGLGGTQGDGRQWVSWIHESDFARAVAFLIANENLSGPVNLCSPMPVQNKAFMATLRRAVHSPVGLSLTSGMIHFGAHLLRTEPELILKSRYVVPSRLLSAGFRFEFADWEMAARDLDARCRKRS
jgi:uncharacterized protein